MSALVSYLNFLKAIYNINPVYIEDVRSLRPKIRQHTEALEEWEVLDLLDAADDIGDQVIICFALLHRNESE